MKIKHKTVEHNGRRYEVQWHRRGEEAKVIVNGVECTDIQLGNRTIFAIIPNGENNLLIEIYYGIFVYVFDVDPCKSIKENTQKYTYNVPFLVRTFCLPIACSPLAFWGALLCYDYPIEVIISISAIACVYLLLSTAVDFIAFHPRMTHRSLFHSLALLLIMFATVVAMVFTMAHFESV